MWYLNAIKSYVCLFKCLLGYAIPVTLLKGNCLFLEMEKEATDSLVVYCENPFQWRRCKRQIKYVQHILNGLVKFYLLAKEFFL